MFAPLLIRPAFALGLALALASPGIAQEEPSLTDIIEAWLASPHAQRNAEAFVHWDEDGAVPESCATCHSGPGLIDFLGGDGTPAGVVDHPAPTGALVDCATCHNRAASVLETVTFPSGETATGLGTSAVCAVCHQGRQSTDDVDAALADGGADSVNPELGFVNVHYRAAAATLFGGTVRGGYQYQGKTYFGQFVHVPEFNTCASCHEPHSTEVVVSECSACHQGIDGLKDIRVQTVDFDGDGDAAEGIHGEISSMHAMLGDAVSAYARDVAGAPVVYDSHAYPYYFSDTDGDGEVDEGEAAFPNRYQSWTPRMLKAAYNYQFVAKDPGGYTHNPKYILQLLYDSLEDLGAAVLVDMSGLSRP